MTAQRIAAGANPGGLVAHLYVDGNLVDVGPLTKETTFGVAHQHGTFAAARIDAGDVVTVRIFDGDTGALMIELGPPGTDDWVEWTYE